MYIYALVGTDSKVVEGFEILESPVDEMMADGYVLVDAVDETWIQRKRYDEATQTFVDLSPSEASYHNSLEFTHIDADGTKHWLDDYVNDLAANSGSVDTSAFAAVDHTHTPASIGAAASSHTHSGYASSSHNHDSKYAPISHTHDYAASSHNHSASNITSGTLAVGRGGTGTTSAKKSVTLNCGSDAASGSFGYTCQYIPYLDMCFIRVYAQPKEAWSADADYEVATLSGTNYKPANMVALSNYAQREVSAYVNTDGQIVVRPYESVGTSYGIRLAGFWFCE